MGPVLVATDDAALSGRLRDTLRADDATVIACRSAAVALASADFHRPSVVVVDLAMENGRGRDLLHGAAAWPGVRWLALDQAGDALARRAALAAGADDVVSAPFDAEEVAARVRSLRKRDPASLDTGLLRHRDLVIDVASHEVRVAGRVVDLTAQQFAILRALVEARGAALHRSQLLARIASMDDEAPSDRAIDLHVSRLRRRLGEPGRRYIEAVYAIGYRIADAETHAPLPADAVSGVLDALDEAVIVVDGDLRIRVANRAAARLLERDDLVGQPCDKILACQTPDGRAVGQGCIGRAVLAGGGRVPSGRLAIRCHGGAVSADLTHSPIRVAGAADLVAIEIRPDRG